MFKRLKCNIKAIPFFIRSGLFIPHVYEEIMEYRTNVFATESSFRESGDYLHTENEKAHINAIVTVNRCVYCGKELKEWRDREPIILGGQK